MYNFPFIFTLLCVTVSHKMAFKYVNVSIYNVTKYVKIEVV